MVRKDGLERLNSNYLLLVLWLFLTVFNINKAFHIDDSFHLEAAQHIVKNPGQPMSGSINWNDTDRKISDYNQPPLFFYLIALVGNTFGFTEVPMHILMALFSLLCLVYFKKIALHLQVEKPNFLLLLFVLCPALLINQNLMVDVPMLACLLGSTFFLLKGLENSKTLVYSMLWFSAGLLIKYSILPFGLLFGLTLILKGKFKELVYGIIPIFFLVAWGIWNFTEFGSSHFLDRPYHQLNFKLLFRFISCLGAVSLFLPALIGGFFKNKNIQISIAFIWVVFFALLMYAFLDNEIALHINTYITWYTITLGCLVLITTITAGILQLYKNKLTFIKNDTFILLLFSIVLTLAMILLPIFMASRHVLLVIPFILLSSHCVISKVRLPLKITTVVIGFAITVILGYSDWLFADFYRKSITEVEQKTTGRVWTRGHWGWQWYSRQVGMLFYDSKQEAALEIGDYIVFPTQLPKQPMSSLITIEGVDTLYEPTGFISFFSARNGRFYNSNLKRTFWSLSHIPLDTIVIAKVVDDFGVADIKKMIYQDSNWLEGVSLKAKQRNLTLDSMVTLDAEYLKWNSVNNGK